MDNNKKSNPNRIFDMRFKEVQQALKKGKPLTSSQEGWLIRERYKYTRGPAIQDTNTKYRIAKLDTLIPLLGRDWRIPKNPSKKQNIGQRIKEVKSKLIEGTPLSKAETGWLQRISNRLRRSTLERDEEFKKLLDTLTPHLGYDWREKGGLPLSEVFEKHYQDILKSIEEKRPVSKTASQWLRSQRYRYASQESNNMPPDELIKLRHLKEILNLPWEITEKKLLETPAEDLRLRKTMEMWFMKLAPYLNFSALELAYGMPKGKLQKFYKYNTRVEYKWILALKDFKDQMKK